MERSLQKRFQDAANLWPHGVRVTIAILVFAALLFNPMARSYNEDSIKMAHTLSNPRLMWYSMTEQTHLYLWTTITSRTCGCATTHRRTPAFLHGGTTATRSRGSGIARAADGNTWNHEHIATIGKLLTSPVAKAHLLIRHLADYVLIWTGSRAEDLMKSPHMARIGNSVYRDICPGDDPLCSNFGFEDYDLSRPTPMMRMSLLYNLHVSGEHPSPAIDNMFRLAYRSRHGLVKIYKVMNVSAESKAWVADPKNRKCDAPGSWLCTGSTRQRRRSRRCWRGASTTASWRTSTAANETDAYYRAYMRRIRNEGRG
ncbi:putative oligosaccharyl transferase subunit [Trypanosoma cruzi]|uniref:Putative oligosaccharyl transferase subunit n=1 Tax=Trypanosoma cruzi TaxID=5693 RepID=A0A2V2UTE9_TRYCR|nr:putative oligosaccharyl transferase subunit [Trypanosoma cruzi]